MSKLFILRSLRWNRVRCLRLQTSLRCLKTTLMAYKKFKTLIHLILSLKNSTAPTRLRFFKLPLLSKKLLPQLSRTSCPGTRRCSTVSELTCLEMLRNKTLIRVRLVSITSLLHISPRYLPTTKTKNLSCHLLNLR